MSPVAPVGCGASGSGELRSVVTPAGQWGRRNTESAGLQASAGQGQQGQQYNGPAWSAGLAGSDSHVIAASQMPPPVESKSHQRLKALPFLTLLHFTLHLFIYHLLNAFTHLFYYLFHLRICAIYLLNYFIMHDDNGF
jgi:hypothetical protein